MIEKLKLAAAAVWVALLCMIVLGAIGYFLFIGWRFVATVVGVMAVATSLYKLTGWSWKYLIDWYDDYVYKKEEFKRQQAHKDETPTI